jgi:hypothetical protein
MADDVRDIILENVQAINDKLDRILEDLGQLDVRMASIERKLDAKFVDANQRKAEGDAAFRSDWSYRTKERLN